MNFLRTLGPCCEECGPKFIEEMSEVSPSLCLDCAEAKELAEHAAKLAERDREFRYASRYWLAVRPLIQTRMCDLVDQKDAEDELIASAALARFMLGERFYPNALTSDTEPLFSAERDSRVAR